MNPITVSSILPKVTVTPGTITITMSPEEAVLFYSLLGRTRGANYKGWQALELVLNEHGFSDVLYEKAAELIRNSYTGDPVIPLDDIKQDMESNLRSRRQGVFA